MRDLVEYIVKSIVEFPDAVIVTELKDEATGKITIRVEVDKRDTGLVIGRKGITANAIRTLAKIKAIREKLGYVNVDIITDDEPPKKAAEDVPPTTSSVLDGDIEL